MSTTHFGFKYPDGSFTLKLDGAFERTKCSLGSSLALLQVLTFIVKNEVEWID